MKTAGIDVGFDSIKVAIMDGDKVLAKTTGLSGGGDRIANIEKLFNDALAAAGLKPEEIEGVVATGIGRYDVKFATDNIAYSIAEAKVAKFFFPEATSVVDIGADQTRVVILDGDGKITETVINQKCMAGIGLVLDDFSYRLGYTLDEISKFAPDAAKDTVVNDGCRVFAELDALEALNRGVPKDQVMAAVINALVVRLNSILHDKVMPAEDTTVLIGGVSRNTAIVNALKARSGVNFLIPEDAVFANAIGCALVAAAG